MGMHPIHVRTHALLEKYPSLKTHQQDILLSENFMDQLDQCQCEEARRLLLGISEKMDSDKNR